LHRALCGFDVDAIMGAARFDSVIVGSKPGLGIADIRTQNLETLGIDSGKVECGFGLEFGLGFEFERRFSLGLMTGLTFSAAIVETLMICPDFWRIMLGSAAAIP
jgi:hypothetical protein